MEVTVNCFVDPFVVVSMDFFFDFVFLQTWLTLPTQAAILAHFPCL